MRISWTGIASTDGFESRFPRILALMVSSVYSYVSHHYSSVLVMHLIRFCQQKQEKIQKVWFSQAWILLPFWV